jgi:hypothetical protein
MSNADPRDSSGVFLPSLGAEDTGSDPLNEQADGGSELIGVGADLPTGHSARSRVSTGTLILLLVVVVAGGVLYIMRQFGLGTRLELVDVKIDYPIDGSATVSTEQHQQVLASLRDSSTTVQVPLNEVKKNPFQLGLREEEAAPEPTSQSPFDREAAERARRKQMIQSTFASLELNSVVGGSVPIARISGDNVRIGDRLKDLFTVRSIRGRSVELVADGEVYILTMGD